MKVWRFCALSIGSFQLFLKYCIFFALRPVTDFYFVLWLSQQHALKVKCKDFWTPLSLRCFSCDCYITGIMRTSFWKKICNKKKWCEWCRDWTWSVMMNAIFLCKSCDEEDASEVKIICNRTWQWLHWISVVD